MTRHAHITQSVHLQGFSPEQLMDVVRGARFEHYVLSSAKCEARLNRWSLGGFTVDRGRYSFPVRIVGEFPKNRLCMGYMRSLTEPTWVNGFTAGQATVEFYPDGAELNYRAAPHGEWVAIEFEESSLQAAARERLGHEVELPWKHVISFPAPRAERLALDRMIARLWTHPISGALMIAPILGAIAEILDARQRESGAASMNKAEYRQMILKRSDDYLRDHLSEPFDLHRIATASGAAKRTLQRMFGEAYGVTPQEWARCLALHRARKLLQSTAARTFTVQAIANECGFRHMGRFASYYRELFGELPSARYSSETWPHDPLS